VKRVSVIAGFLACLMVVSATAAQEPTPTTATARQPSPDEVNRVAAQLYCPVCENEPLDVCQTSACVQWKAQIGQFLAEGKSDEEIKQIFVQRFGLRVLGEPPAQGVSLILWIGPIVAVLLGGFYAVRTIRRLSQRGAVAPAPTGPEAASTGDEYRDRVERDLKQQL